MRRVQLLVLSLAGAIALPAWGARGFTDGALYSYRQDRAFSNEASADVIAGLKAAPGVTIRVKEIGRVNGRPLHRVDIVPPARPGAPPVRVGIAAGVHYEPQAVWTAHELMQDAARGKAGNVAYTFYPVVNPAGQAAQQRANDQGSDVNRSFAPGTLSPESRAVTRDLRGKEFDLFLDLHGSLQDGFFVIGGQKDDPFAVRAMRALPTKLRMQRSTSGTYALGNPGVVSSNNVGTLRSFVAQTGARAYTVEYPRRAQPRWQRQGMRRLVDSLVRHAAAEQRQAPRPRR